MRKLLGMVLVGVFLAAGSAQAFCGKCGAGDGSKAGAQETANAHVEKMAKEFKLTPEQKMQVEVIVKEKWDKKQKIMDDKQAAMDALREETRAKLKGVLNEGQMKQWEAKSQYQCSGCKDGKPCDTCKGMTKGKCPACKDGKPCDTCSKMKKGWKKGKKSGDCPGHYGEGNP